MKGGIPLMMDLPCNIFAQISLQSQTVLNAASTWRMFNKLEVMSERDSSWVFPKTVIRKRIPP